MLSWLKFGVWILFIVVWVHVHILCLSQVWWHEPSPLCWLVTSLDYLCNNDVQIYAIGGSLRSSDTEMYDTIYIYTMGSIDLYLVGTFCFT